MGKRESPNTESGSNAGSSYIYVINDPGGALSSCTYTTMKCAAV